MKNLNKIKKIVKSNLLTSLFASFKNGLRANKSKEPREYLASKKIDHNKLEVGFNSGQFHHRKSDEFKKQYVEANILTQSNAPVNSPESTPYTVFAKYSVVFPLRAADRSIVNFFATRFKLSKSVNQYLNEHGVYPEYPSPLTQRLFVTHDVYDAASVIQSGTLENRDAVISLKEGELTECIKDAIQTIEGLRSIFIVSKNKQNGIINNLEQITRASVDTIFLPTGKSLNDVWCDGDVSAVFNLLNSKSKNEEAAILKIPLLSNPKLNTDLNVISPQHIEYIVGSNKYEVKGSLPKDLGSMKVMLVIHIGQASKTDRGKIDLYQTDRVEKYAERLSSKYGVNANTILHDLEKLCDLLEEHRDKQFNQFFTTNSLAMEQNITPEAKKAAVEFLKSEDIIQRLDNYLEQTGVIGEEKTRMLLFVVATTLLSDIPLHAIVQGSSGSGKSHLVNAILECVPEHMRIDVTSITSKSLYHYQGDDLVNKLFVIQDFDGLNESALFAFRELQSLKRISNSTTGNNMMGNHNSFVEKVKANFASLVATTQQNIYYDNQSRSIIVGVDESNAQTDKILEYDNKRFAGLIDKSAQERAKVFLQNCVKVLKSVEVINPYATQIHLPDKAKMKRRLNNQFQAFILQVTRLHQYQRETNADGKLITTIEDIELAIDLFFDAIILKIDELTSITRQFFEGLKEYMASPQCKSSAGEFTQREVRQALNLGKTQVSQHIKVLMDYEYVAISGGSANRGFTYQIVYADNNQKLRNEVKGFLKEQVKNFTKPNTTSH